MYRVVDYHRVFISLAGRMAKNRRGYGPDSPSPPPPPAAGITQKVILLCTRKGGLKNGLEEIAYNAGIMCSFRLEKGDSSGGLRFPVGLRGQWEEGTHFLSRFRRYGGTGMVCEELCMWVTR